MKSKLGVSAFMCVAAAVVLSSTASASSGTLVVTANMTLTEDHAGSIVVARTRHVGLRWSHNQWCRGRIWGWCRSVRPEQCDGERLPCHQLRLRLLPRGHEGSTFRSNVAEENHLTGFDINDSSHNTFVGQRCRRKRCSRRRGRRWPGERVQRQLSRRQPCFGVLDHPLQRQHAEGERGYGQRGRFVHRVVVGERFQGERVVGQRSVRLFVNPYTDHAQPENNTLSGNIARG